MDPVRLHRRQIKTALKRGNLSGSFIAAKYRLSPYMACEHGCLYCDGRAERYWVEGEFDRDIVVRTNLPDLLSKELPKLRERGWISVGSGITDAYQPAEASERIMGQCAEVLADHEFPVTIMTKSALILRDLELWSRVNEKSAFMVLVSLVFSQDEDRRVFEPRASSVEKRLEILRAFKAAGCYTGVLAMPVLPYISDTEENLRALYERLAEIGVDWIMPGGLTLRPGRQKDGYLDVIGQRYPQHLADYKRLYAEERPSGSPIREYLTTLGDRFRKVASQYSIPALVPHHIYRDHVHLYDEVNVLLHHMTELYEPRGIDTAPLKGALKRYMGWLEDRKRQYNRHPSWRYTDLSEELRDKASSGELPKLLGNTKLAAFISEIVIDRKTFDYVTLRPKARNRDATGP